MESLHRTMSKIATFFWVLACDCSLYLLGFIDRFLFRLEADDFEKTDLHEFGEVEIAECFSGFKFGNYETEDREDSVSNPVFGVASPTPNTSRYEVISSNDFSEFMEEPETISFSVQELYVGCSDDDYSNANRRSPEKGFGEIHLKAFEDSQMGSDDSLIVNDRKFVRANCVEEFDEIRSETVDVVLEKPEEFVCVQSSSDENMLEKPEVVFSTDSDHELEFNKMGLHSFSETIDSPENGDDHDDEFMDYNPVDDKLLELPEQVRNLEEFQTGGPVNFHGDSEVTSTSREKAAEDSEDEYIEFEPNLDADFIREEEQKTQINHEQEPEDDEFDVLLRHQELIEQMKSEVRKCRNIGLPTILEECETPKIADDLKPLKIEEKFDHKDRMEEIQKVYKGYAEKMRKLDVLNYQTLQAISFLQLKDTDQRVFGQKSSVSAIKSLLLPNRWPGKLRRIYADPSLKSIAELERSLEIVYVGQTCLSWEILHWQYEKAMEMLEYDSEGYFHYNQVAGEFQQLQVLVQRFVENEPFQGPRVPSYAKYRCELRTLFQVPALKEDCLKDVIGVEEDNVVSIAKLAETMYESMHIFWEFIRADKDESNAFLKGLQTSHVHLHDPSDFQRVMEIKMSLQKKEKKLKDIVRTGNCIVKKFQRHQETRKDRHILIAQVDMRLVSRVLNMSRLTSDQLEWCEKKLNKINLVHRKVYVEPSFLLFP